MLDDTLENSAASHVASVAGRAALRRPIPASDRLQILAGLLRVGDLAAVPAGAAIAFYLRYQSLSFAARDWLIVLLATLLGSCCLHILRAYDGEVLRGSARQLPRVAAAWAATILLVISGLYFAKAGEEFSRSWLLLWLVGSLVLLISLRLAGAAAIARWQRNGLLVRRVALLCVGPAARDKTSWLGRSREVRIVLAELYTPAALDAVAVAARSGRIDEIVIATTGGTWQTIERIVARLSGIAVSIKLYHDAFDLPFMPGKVELLAGRPLFGIAERPLACWRQFVKRAEDIVLSALLLILALPLMLAITLAVRLDSPGPVLFRQQRFGFNGELIIVYKFRSMYYRDEPDHLMVQARRNDARVTRVGGLLRRTSLDELPQLFNVLRGEMSLVGPRPHPVALDERFAQIIDGYLARHRVKPGITGWAQVNGLRGETDTNEKMQRRVQHDLYYINNWSLLLDFKILLFTALVGLIDENAY